MIGPAEPKTRLVYGGPVLVPGVPGEPAPAVQRLIHSFLDHRKDLARQCERGFARSGASTYFTPLPGHLLEGRMCQEVERLLAREFPEHTQADWFSLPRAYRAAVFIGPGRLAFASSRNT